MPRAQFGVGEYYHIYNRGVEKRPIFSDDNDYWRFVTLLLVLQGDVLVPKINRLVSDVQRWRLDNDIFREVIKYRYAELVCFCLMPNHFHLLVRELKEGGISKFMQRLADAHTKYFNIKYHRTGHLFGGKFHSVLIDQNRYLNYLSVYIHLNSTDIPQWGKNALDYPWSSYQDFVRENRFGRLLNPDIILGQFSSSKEYQRLVETTPTKAVRRRLDTSYLFD